VADERRFADVESMRPVVRAAFGGGRSLLGVERLAHGSKKGAYRLTMDDGGTALAYAWDDAEDYWQGVLPEGADDLADPFSHSSGLALFEAAARRLASAGVRCPGLLLADRSRALYPADIAVVEDIAGGSLEALLEKDPVAAERPLSVIADWLTAMAAVRSPSLGKVAFVDEVTPDDWTPLLQAVRGQANREPAVEPPGPPLGAGELRDRGPSGHFEAVAHTGQQPVELVVAQLDRTG
jgi:hypothetical protein